MSFLRQCQGGWILTLDHRVNGVACESCASALLSALSRPALRQTSERSSGQQLVRLVHPLARSPARPGPPRLSPAATLDSPSSRSSDSGVSSSCTRWPSYRNLRAGDHHQR